MGREFVYTQKQFDDEQIQFSFEKYLVTMLENPNMGKNATKLNLFDNKREGKICIKNIVLVTAIERTTFFLTVIKCAFQNEQ